MKVYSFPRGGLIYTDPTVPPNKASLTAFLPGLSIIPLRQHSGELAVATVGVGDHVREGALVGQGQGAGSANIHATVPGEVIKTVSWKNSRGIVNEALVIRMEGRFDKIGKEEELIDWTDFSPIELQRLIADKGIVEMEGEGEPIADLLASFLPLEARALVIRCVFDDPWRAADSVLCKERLSAIIEGAAILAKAASVRFSIFAVSQKEKALHSEIQAHPLFAKLDAQSFFVSSRYPQGNRRELELVLREYGQDQGLEPVSYMIVGPATCAAVHDAVKLNKPILNRYVAVGGSAVRKPHVLKVRLGTRIGEVFAECGGFCGKPARIAIGSPLLGYSIADLDEPIVKTSFAVFALLKRQIGKAPERDCIACGECRAVCPVGLDPEELFKHARLKQEVAPGLQASLCHGCACCELVCPSRLPLSSVIQNAAALRVDCGGTRRFLPDAYKTEEVLEV
ncbi:SLBB domain-containing protein [Breznakiellaceae bacterium SP9]